MSASVNWLDQSSPLPAARAYAMLDFGIACKRAALVQLVVPGRSLEPFDATRQLLLSKAVDDITQFAPHSLDICSDAHASAMQGTPVMHSAGFYPKSSAKRACTPLLLI